MKFEISGTPSAEANIVKLIRKTNQNTTLPSIAEAVSPVPDRCSTPETPARSIQPSKPTRPSSRPTRLPRILATK